MKKNFNQEEELTYVLFGTEAIQVFGISVKMVLASEQLVYNVGAYNDLKEFFDESKKWGDFIEINEKDYLALKKRLAEKSLIENNGGQSKTNKKPSFFNFFK